MIPSDIHKIADEMGVEWDGDPDFMKWCKTLTGLLHLDDMSSDQLMVIAKALKGGDKPGRRIMGFWRYKEGDPKTRLEDYPNVSLGNF